MAPTNFDLAPPAATVDGLLAVPCDIQRVTATLEFDGAASSGRGDATVEFTTGPEAGNPIFDLRQTITSAWLDAAPLPPDRLSHHDFGGGAQAELRVIEAVLGAGEAHTLRVQYQLGPPQASTAGSYLPALTWAPGPRLSFNFGFTDLGAGRYLEAWVPANLIFDQFELVLTLRLLNTAVPHAVITNGAVTEVGPHEWSVTFPGRFTALSPLLEVRAQDTLTRATGTVTLPVSGNTVTVEAWKPASGSVDLNTQIGNLRSWLAANEVSTGPYLHGSRFVAFLNVGGMEYEGGTTSSPGPLRHETFHSWWARGVKPASQADAWWDEAWTVYNDQGAAGSLPFDFSEPPVELCPRNPWARITAPDSYGDGNRFFAGVASLIGVANLNALMSEFYDRHLQRPVTTTDLEEFLVCRSGNPQLVGAFHRFVFGFAEPVPAVDLWLRDDPEHGGADSWPGRFWDSPDLWVRHAEDDGTTHQAPVHGRDNWFYARVRNRSLSAARHFLVTFNVKSFAGTEFVYPADFLPCIAATSHFDLEPGASAVVKARWPAALVPPTGTHACWLAAVLARSDLPRAGRHVWEHNNLAQKNLTIVELAPGDSVVIPFVVHNLAGPQTKRLFLELLPTPEGNGPHATLLHDPRVAVRPPLDARVGPAGLGPGVALRLPPGPGGRIPLSVRPEGQFRLGLRLTVPDDTKSGDVLRSDLVQRDKATGSIVGGLAVEIRVV